MKGVRANVSLAAVFVCLLLLAVVGFVAPTQAWARGDDQDAVMSGPLLLHKTWAPTDEGNLEAAVVMMGPQASPSESELKIYDKGREVFSFSPHFTPVSLFSNAEQGPQLFSLWESGSGRYWLYAFVYADGKVSRVLEVASQMIPEFVYANDKNHPEQRIVVSNMEWEQDAKTGQKALLPVSADIYRWDGKAYQIRKAVPWIERLK